jgi:argininosuccinate lyase
MTILLNVDRLAEDLQIWTTAEFDVAELADRHARTSMIMPQKKNPYALAYVRGMTNSTLGAMVSMAAVGRSPSAQVDNRIFAIGEVPRTVDHAVGTVRLMAAVLRDMTFRTDRMRARTREGYGQATDVAEVLMQAAGINYRTAHGIVGTAVRLAVEAGAPPGTIPAEFLDKAARAALGRPVSLPADAVASLSDPSAIVATRTGTGGAAPEVVRAMLDDCRHRLAEGTAWATDARARTAAAEARLVARAATLAAAPVVQ